VLEKYRYTEAEQKKLLNSIVIIVDKQEKVNDHITDYFDKHKILYINRSLDNGDYSFFLPKNEELAILKDWYFTDSIIIERKNSAEELATCLSQTRDRFENEFLRSKAHKKYLLIESTNYKDIVNGNYNTQYNSKSYLGSLHSFNQKYNLEIVFMPDKTYSAIFIYATFQYYLRNLLK
jgi:ERCC4-type nuclease